eukprot:1769043-Pyramimonas_sp.AAC.1
MPRPAVRRGQGGRRAHRAGHLHYQRARSHGLHGRPQQLRGTLGPRGPSMYSFQEGHRGRGEAPTRGPAEGAPI